MLTQLLLPRQRRQLSATYFWNRCADV